MGGRLPTVRVDAASPLAVAGNDGRQMASRRSRRHLLPDSVDAVGLTIGLPANVERVARTSPAAREAACDAAVRALKAPRSQWRVDTGRSKRAWRRLGSGRTSRVYNPVNYARYLEDGVPSRQTRGLAARTLAQASPALLRAARSKRQSSTAQRRARHRKYIQRAAKGRQARETSSELYRQYAAERGRARRSSRLRAFERALRLGRAPDN